MQAQKLFDTYHQVEKFVIEHKLSNFTAIRTMFEEKIKQPDANIMVYGVYNAGKSTLINALVGKEVAPTGDIPLTAKVAEYQCDNFVILDTPGIDAPSEHEAVTQEQLLKADAVIFVVNPLGIVEEQATLDALMNLFAEGKKVFLVFNEKNPLKDEDFILLKDQTRQRLQAIAQQRGLNNVLTKISITRINAKVALMGKQKDKPKLLEASHYLAFKRELDTFIKSISQKDIYNRLHGTLAEYLNQNIQAFEQGSQQEVVKKYEQLVAKVTEIKIQTRTVLANQINSDQQELKLQIRAWLYEQLENKNSDFSSKVEQWMDLRSKKIETQLADALDMATINIKNQIEDVTATIPKASIQHGHVANIEFKKEIYQQSATSEQGLDFDSIAGGFKSVTDVLTTDHIVTGLNVFKSTMPGLMKGIGQKTIEKWAGTIAGKAIPYVGTIITIALTLRDLFKDDPEAARLQRQQEAEQRAYERAQQQIEDTSKEVSDNFSDNLSIAINQAIDEFFQEIVNNLKKISDHFNVEDQKNSLKLEGLLQLKDQLNHQKV